ncbi:MAG: glycoside hydrolase family 2 protein, partial [Oscillospiraceae bacterium]
YDEHYFRFCSEFGFEAFPCMETIKTFALEEDMNPFSRVMESHQKCECGNARILSYLSENYRYPYSFSELVYISQILQAEAIEYGVEHFRRNRGRCMGAIYWQLNDCWPGPSWASIDYGGNYKALQFRAGHFFAKTLLSAKKSAKVLTLNISHEGVESFDGKVKLSVCDNFFNIKFSKDYLVSVDRLSSKDIDTIDLNPYIDDFETYVAIELYDKDNNLISQNSTIFVKPKYYNYQNPTVTIQKSSDNNSIIVKSDCYTRGVYLSASGIDFSENFFDIVSAEGVRIPIRNEIENVIVDEINILAVNYIGK